MVLPPDTVDECDVVEGRKAVAESRSREGGIADVVIVDERAEFTAELPPRHPGVRAGRFAIGIGPPAKPSVTSWSFEVKYRFFAILWRPGKGNS